MQVGDAKPHEQTNRERNRLLLKLRVNVDKRNLAFWLSNRDRNLVLPVSVTRLGDFCNFLVTIFITKVAQMFGDFMGSCENHRFLSQTGEATFWVTFAKTWATFYFNIWSHCTQSSMFCNILPHFEWEIAEQV